jgi:hypothetical protein
MRCPNDAAHGHVLIPISAQVANVVPIFRKTEQGESALSVGEIGRADVKEAGAVFKFDERVNVGGNANVLVGFLGSFANRETGLTCQFDRR